MAEVQVYLLNFHGLTSHIEIVLEKKSSSFSTFYGLNRWEAPSDIWLIEDDELKASIEQASSVYCFTIDANPTVIAEEWRKYWYRTEKDASIFGKNCAVAVQWFLNKFAEVPKPGLNNVSLNHLILGFMLPSFLPCPVMLPGRVMSNAKFHLKIRKNPAIVDQYSRLFLYASMALAAFVFAGSMFALAVAATMLSGGIAALVITSCVAVGFVGSYGFFKAYNCLSQKNIVDKLRGPDGTSSLLSPLCLS